MPKTKRSHTKTLTQVRAATLADVRRLLAQPRVAASAGKRIKGMRAARTRREDQNPNGNQKSKPQEVTEEAASVDL
jgi:hypothetical protein